MDDAADAIHKKTQKPSDNQYNGNDIKQTSHIKV